MSRIAKAFAQKNAFVGYLTAGDGDSKVHFLSLLEGGVNVLEIGIPFSDPIADGPTIQKAMERSLKAGTKLKDVLELVSFLRSKTEVPMILFTYFNPIQRDLKGFLQKAKVAGADGVLVVDLSLEESGEYRALCRQIGLDPIFVIAPSTPPERISQIASEGRGFLYYACRKGTTGAREGFPADLETQLRQIRSLSNLPIAVGFGVAKREVAAQLLTLADGFVVGSFFVDGIAQGKDLKQLAEEIKP